MKKIQFTTAISLFFIFLLIIVGVTLLCITQYPNLGIALAFLFTKNPKLILYLGITSCSLAFLFFIILYRYYGNKYYTIKMGDNYSSVNPIAIENTLKPYWEALFEDKNVSCSVTIEENIIEINTIFPKLSLERQKELLQMIEVDLEDILYKTFRYESTFMLIAQFQ